MTPLVITLNSGVQIRTTAITHTITSDEAGNLTGLSLQAAGKTQRVLWIGLDQIAAIHVETENRR